MPEMYCPQCGRQLDLDSGEIRFCRYCGFSLVDTKEALHGYSEQKRMAGSETLTLSYAGTPSMFSSTYTFPSPGNYEISIVATEMTGNLGSTAPVTVTIT